MKIALAQLNPVVGDIDGNCLRLIETVRHLNGAVDLVVFSELYLAGYPPRDLLAEPWFLDKVREGIQRIVDESKNFGDTGVLFGAPVRTGDSTGLGLFNSALLAYQGNLLFTQHKSLLPTYDVFDEARYFDEARSIAALPFKHEILGISICEDAWNDPELWQKRIYPFDPVAELVKQGATVLINISASPFYLGKDAIRYRLIHNHARKHQRPFIFVNQVGGNDELVFDGRSMAFDRDGNPTALLPAFVEDVRIIDSDHLNGGQTFKEQDRIEALYYALVLGIRDYLRKCGFKKAAIGLSGGIDSALVCALAAEAIGPENVIGIAMPSRFSAEESTTLAQKLAANLNVGIHVVPIETAYTAYLTTLASLGVDASTVSVTLENIQARIRGNFLMALSNEVGAIVLSTGNKSELAMGYCTLYGDMVGGLAVISDVPKTMVYALSRYINREREIIPDRIITRPPSAELRPNQTDQDTLPPYDILDRILVEHIENHRSLAEITALGFDPTVVAWVLKTVSRNEYKRRQAAPGFKVTSRAFGLGRRMPIAAKYQF
ncbi:MAG: NAD+ synthase [candidate division Zixibacteria bacterium]|nr:NAD+ synthase [candidate division Zixibacteria bacterium]